MPWMPTIGEYLEAKREVDAALRPVAAAFIRACDAIVLCGWSEIAQAADMMRGWKSTKGKTTVKRWAERGYLTLRLCECGSPRKKRPTTTWGEVAAARDRSKRAPSKTRSSTSRR
jgi:hypothetical protein